MIELAFAEVEDTIRMGTSKSRPLGLELMLSLLLFSVSFLGACTSTGGYMKTVDRIEIDRFMGDWYVLAGRFTFLEKDVHNALEAYTWNEEKNRIDIAFTFNKGSFEGPVRSIPQKGWVENKETKAHWKVSPLWPLKLDYLVVALAEDYSWTAIGVPNQKYLWIMARDWRNPEPVVKEALRSLEKIGYPSDRLVFVPHRWPRPKKE